MCPQMGLKNWKTYFLLKHMKHDIQLLEMTNDEYVHKMNMIAQNVPSCLSQNWMWTFVIFCYCTNSGVVIIQTGRQNCIYVSYYIFYIYQNKKIKQITIQLLCGIF